MLTENKNIIRVCIFIAVFAYMYIPLNSKFINQFNLLINGQNAIATVVSNDSEMINSSKGSISLYKPTLKFTLDGNTFTINNDMNSSNYISFEKGSKIPIKYNKNDPNDAIISSPIFIFSVLLGVLISNSIWILASFGFGLAQLINSNKKFSLNVSRKKRILSCILITPISLYGIIVIIAKIKIDISNFLFLIGIIALIIYIFLIIKILKSLLIKKE